VLDLLWEGYGEREAAEKLRVSHTTVIRRRRAIAKVAWEICGAFRAAG
jgi:hypothetical protein